MNKLIGARLFQSGRIIYYPAVSRRRVLLCRILGMVLALVLIGLFLASTGHSPLAVGAAIVKAAVGSSYGVQQVLILATPIIITAIAASICMRMGIWNIGAEGQLFIGALAATFLGLNLNVPGWLGLVLMLLAGALGGLLWALLPALLKAFAEVNELISTLLLNSVATLLVMHVVGGALRDYSQLEIIATRRVPYQLPGLFGMYLHVGILIALGLAVLTAIVLKYTRWGYELAIIGGNRKAAEFSGINVFSRTLTVFLLSGAIAGIAGMIEITGTAHRLSAVLSPGYGYMGLTVTVLASNSPLGVVLVGTLYAVLLNAGIVLRTQGISTNFVLVITGSILLFATVGEMVAHYRVVRVAGAPDAAVNNHTVALSTGETNPEG